MVLLLASAKLFGIISNRIIESVVKCLMKEVWKDEHSKKIIQFTKNSWNNLQLLITTKLLKPIQALDHKSTRCDEHGLKEVELQTVSGRTRFLTEDAFATHYASQQLESSDALMEKNTALSTQKTATSIMKWVEESRKCHEQTSFRALTSNEHAGVTILPTPSSCCSPHLSLSTGHKPLFSTSTVTSMEHEIDSNEILEVNVVVQERTLHDSSLTNLQTAVDQLGLSLERMSIEDANTCLTRKAVEEEYRQLNTPPSLSSEIDYADPLGAYKWQYKHCASVQYEKVHTISLS